MEFKSPFRFFLSSSAVSSSSAIDLRMLFTSELNVSESELAGIENGLSGIANLLKNNYKKFIGRP